MEMSAKGLKAVAIVGLVTAISAGLILSAKAQEKLSSFADELSKASQNAKQMCQLIVIQNGTMVQNIGATKLSSQINAAMPGLAEITTTNASYALSVDPPGGFSSAPQGGNSDVVFNSSLSGHGATNFAETPGNIRVRLKKGVTQVDVNLVAEKLSSSFPAGNYVAELTLRCE